MHRIKDMGLVQRILEGMRDVKEAYPDFNMEHPEGESYDNMRESVIWPNPDDMFTPQGISRQIDKFVGREGYINFCECTKKWNNQIGFGREWIKV